MAIKDKVRVTGVWYRRGLVCVIESNGEMVVYLQKGINELTEIERHRFINYGVIVSDWKNFKVIPSNHSIITDDISVTGKIYATYNPNRVMKCDKAC